MPSLEELLQTVDSFRSDMVDALTELIRVPAIGPESGGEGEFERARYVRDLVDKCGFDDVEMFDALDERVRLRLRPNIVAKKQGRSEQSVWVISHMDTVPPGDLDSWSYPPFSPKEVDGKLYGLGSEDNGQSLIGSLFAAKALNKLGLEPQRTMALAFVSDEEMGSDKGIKFLINEGVFNRNDFIYVPDYGVPEGNAIEIAEKHVIWLKFRVYGKQTHASTPEKGLNAVRVSNQLSSFLVDHLQAKYHGTNGMFMPPASTFEPTKRLQTVGNVNSIPAEDTFFLDMRVLPQYDADEVMATIQNVVKMFEDRSGAKITVEFEQFTRSGPPSSPESVAMMALASAIKDVKGVDAVPKGIGGGTCANLFRLAGLEAYTWETCDEMAHTVNEYCIIDNLVSDARVFATLMANLCYPNEFR